MNRFAISAPDTKADTIRKSTGVTIEWDSPGSVDSVGIELVYNQIFSKLADSTAPSTAWRIARAVRNTGTYTFNSSNLSTMPTKGFVEIMIVAAKQKSKTVNGFPVRAAVLTASKTMCTVRS